MKTVRVGLGVFVIRDDKILLGQRINSHGQGTWQLPGGHLELYETFEECAKREVKEETGLKITNVLFVTATNDIFTEEDKHYVTIFMRAKSSSGTPVIMEPDKCTVWNWFSWDELPEPLFLPLKNLIQTNFKLFDQK